MDSAGLIVIIITKYILLILFNRIIVVSDKTADIVTPQLH